MDRGSYGQNRQDVECGYDNRPGTIGRPTSLSLKAGYAVTHDDDNAGRLNRVSRPGLPAYGAVYEQIHDGQGTPLSEMVD